MLLLIAATLATATPSPGVLAHPGEEPVDTYVQSDVNAGADPFAPPRMYAAFHGADGVARIVDGFVARNLADPRIGDIFRGQDMIRLKRVLNEQFCYLLGGGCPYSGRDMKTAHKDMGIQSADFGALVENLQRAMNAEKVDFRAQNRFLAKLAPMKRVVVER